MGQGRFRHDATAKYNTIHGDLFIGWKAHILRTKKAPIVRLGLSKYLVGISRLELLTSTMSKSLNQSTYYDNILHTLIFMAYRHYKIK